MHLTMHDNRRNIVLPEAAVYLGGKRTSDTFDIFESQLSHFSLCVIIPSSLHPPDVSLLIFSSSYLLFLRLFCAPLPPVVIVVLFRPKNPPHRGNFAGICEQICYDFFLSFASG